MPLPLPLELYGLITQNVVEEADLHSLALCGTIFRHDAQRFLFRDAQPTSFHQQKQLLAAINGAPLRLGPLVHTFYADEWGTHDDGVEALAIALQAMCRLEHLKLCWQMPSRILQECTFTLRTFVCTFLLDPAEVLFLLSTFIPTQKSTIQRIEIHSNNPVKLATTEIPNDLRCPRLKSVGVDNERLASVFLHDTIHITHFQWFKHFAPPPLTPCQLNHLKSFFFRINKPHMNVSFTQHLTSLVRLELDIIVRYAHNLLPKLMFLQNIPQLQVLVLDIKYSEPYSRITDDEFHFAFTTPFQQAFEHCPRLKHIDVKRCAVRGARYTRLLRPTIREDGGVVWIKHPLRTEEVKEWRFRV